MPGSIITNDEIWHSSAWKETKNNESVFKKSLDTWVIVYDRAKFYKIKWVHKNIYNS